MAAQRGGVRWAPSLAPGRRCEDQGWEHFRMEAGPRLEPLHTLGPRRLYPPLCFWGSKLRSLSLPLPSSISLSIPLCLLLPPLPPPQSFLPVTLTAGHRVNRWGLSGLQVTYCFCLTSLMGPVLCIDTGRTEVLCNIP